VALAPGTRLGAYEILTLIGRGGMGEVYKARDTRLDRTVAIKVLPTELAGDPDLRARFEREARAIATLSHPNILAIHEFGDDGGTMFAAMELLEGETLRARLDRGALPPRTSIDYARRIADGLAAAHARGVVHRDLKPENLFVTRDNQIKILDFGLAQLSEATGDSPTVSPLTEPGTMMGTVGYAAPEQVRGAAADARADIFALGAVLYEMLEGHRAFKGSSPFDVVASILTSDPPPLTVSGANAEALETVIRRCVDKNPDQRFQAARDLRFALDAVDHLPKSQLTKSRWMGRGRVTATLLVLSILASAAYVVIGRLTAHRSGASAAATARSGPLVRVVVLPFENLGPPEDGYFASGVTEEITSRLAGVGGLGVISRTSAAQYVRSGKSSRQIGQELGADYILEGGVRWQRDAGGSGRIRITPQLVRVADDTHVWAERYDRVVAEIFPIQADIAERVAESLDLRLLAPARSAIESDATKNVEAYEAYLRGIDYRSRPDNVTSTGARQIVESFERAVALDPRFGMAQARLSSAHSMLYRLGIDVSDTRLAKAKAGAESARDLLPDSPWVHLALGNYYYARNDYALALDEFVAAQKGMPGSSEVYALLGYTQRRQGRIEDALGSFQRAAELDPRSSNAMRDIAFADALLRRYDEAIRYDDRAIALDPNQVITYWEKSAVQLNSGRPLDEARLTLAAMPKTDDPYVLRAWLRLELLARDYRAALARVEAQRDGFVDQAFFWPKPLLLGNLYRLLGDADRARTMYGAAQKILERERDERPKDARVRSALGGVHAGLGRREEAIREARLGVELVPPSNDAMMAPVRVEDLARVYTLVGDHGAALDQLEHLLTMPSFFFSIRLLELDPAWDPLRGLPRYRALVAAHKR
jgi:TolB-like protein/Flp pilus assembly protein TadD